MEIDDELIAQPRGEAGAELKAFLEVFLEGLAHRLEACRYVSRRTAHRP
jgi:hypothetical protein